MSKAPRRMCAHMRVRVRSRAGWWLQPCSLEPCMLMAGSCPSRVALAAHLSSLRPCLGVAPPHERKPRLEPEARVG